MLCALWLTLTIHAADPTIKTDRLQWTELPALPQALRAHGAGALVGVMQVSK